MRFGVFSLQKIPSCPPHERRPQRPSRITLWQNAEDECKKQTYEQRNPIFSSIFVANLHHSRRVFFARVKKNEPRRLSLGETTMI